MNTDEKEGGQEVTKVLVSMLSWELLILLYIAYAIITWKGVRQVYDDFETYD